MSERVCLGGELAFSFGSGEDPELLSLGGDLESILGHGENSDLKLLCCGGGVTDFNLGLEDPALCLDKVMDATSGLGDEDLDLLPLGGVWDFLFKDGENSEQLGFNNVLAISSGLGEDESDS